MEWFFMFLEKIIKWSGEISMPWKKKILQAEEIRKALELAEEIDTILVTSGGEGSNLLFKFLPGKFKFTHSGMGLGDEKVFDATRIGVDTRDLLKILNGYYRVAILRPKLTEEEKELVRKKIKEITELDKNDNIEYNYRMIGINLRKDGAPESTTCSQFVRVLYNAGREGFIGLKNPVGFLPGKFFKRFETVSPNDLYDLDKFELIYDSEIDRGNKNG